MGFYLSKSKYVEGVSCLKAAWLTKYKPEEKKISSIMQHLMDEGNVIGDLAMGLFGDFVETTTYKQDGSLDLAQMCKKTEECIKQGVENICEAAFMYNNLYCAVDILRKEEDGYSVYEVKATKNIKDYHIIDLAFQRFVLEKCGINLKRLYLVLKSDDYIRGEEFEPDKFFALKDVTDMVTDEISEVEDNLNKIYEVLKSKEEPDEGFSRSCFSPYECGYFEYCKKCLPENSVFDLRGMKADKKIKLYKKGIVTFDDVKKRGVGLSAIQQMQIDYANCQQPYVDKSQLREFLGRIKFPVYFLDFESYIPPFPEFTGMKTGRQMLFQFSLHYIDKVGGTLGHKEFLGESGEDNRRLIAEKLVEYIPDNASVIVYNARFESTAIKELANDFHDLSDKLMKINDNIVDLYEPFSEGFYYDGKFGKSLSIKTVLPVLCPNDPELDYSNLEGVHKGDEAMTVFPMIKDKPIEEQKKIRESLLKYCCLDTLATVKILEKLYQVVSE